MRISDWSSDVCSSDLTSMTAFRFVHFAGAAALALTALFAAPQPAAAQSKKIRIGFVTTLSGPNAAYGQDMKDSVELALDHLGRKMGGIPVEVIYEDDEQKPRSEENTSELQALMR